VIVSPLGRDTAIKARLAAASPEAARILAGGALRDCADVRVQHAITAAVADPDLEPTERDWVLAVLRDAGADAGDDPRDTMLRVRLTTDEMSDLQARAESAETSMSDLVRAALWP